MKWLSVSDEAQLLEMKELSGSLSKGSVIIFKHSTRCSISILAKGRLERKWNLDPLKYPVYYVDVLNFKAISNKIAEQYLIEHQSPQLLIIKDGKCVYNASQSAISFDGISDFLNN
jgi:bacillithiol system protein YtxJ